MRDETGYLPTLVSRLGNSTHTAHASNTRQPVYINTWNSELPQTMPFAVEASRSFDAPQVPSSILARRSI